MPATTSTSSGISQRTNVYAERQNLKHAAPHIVLSLMGLNKPLPKNKGVNIRYRRPRVQAAAIAPLVEGVTPPTSAFAYDDVDVQLRQYGHLIEITDVIEDTHEDPVLQDATVQSGENLGRTVEALTYGVVRAGTNVFFSNGTARNNVNTVLTLNRVRDAVRALKRQKAMPITSVLASSTSYATRAVEPAYVAVCHTDLEPDIRNLPGFLPVAQYGQRSTVHEMEVGTVENVRFVTSADLAPFADAGGTAGTAVLSTTGTSADVYPVMMLGKEAFGTVALRGQGAVEPIIIPTQQRDKSDPLGQRGYVGWKTWFASVILNQLWMARIEVAATRL